ncbi:aldo-keto reductase AKR2E4-like [Battus philenor]|uniref:aldo-keto reductase AKR2E4-like n=1 Tax=Battus philenor TaxID=42288 RepID=UPI0035D03221
MLLSLILFSSIFHAFCDEIDGGKAPRVLLNDGNTIPVFGFGTFLGFDEKGRKYSEQNETENSVLWALNAGYRLIDTASLYLNEDQVGRGIQKSNVPRENVYIVTKLGQNEQRHVIEALRGSLARLNTSYVDLYLIHFPVALKPDLVEIDVVDYVDTWKGMEEAKRLGLAKSIGISNFNISQIDRLLANCEIKPAVLQVEVNLNLAQDKLIEHAKKQGMAVMAYSPFGGLFSKSDIPPPPRKDHPILKNIAKKYGKTTPQIVLHYLVQRGLIPIPKSLHKERVEENIDIFDFQLTDDEMQTLSEFNKDYRTVWPSYWQDHPYYPFEKKDVPDKNEFTH